MRMTDWVEIGPCKLACADCRSVLPELEAGSVDSVVTDPPYVHKHMDGSGFASARKFYAGGALDGMTDFDFGIYSNVLFAGKLLVAFHSRDLIADYSHEAKQRGWTYDLHVWYKTNAIPFCCNTWKSDLEYIAVAWSGTKNMLRGLPQLQYSKMYQSPLIQNKEHPAQKPTELIMKYLVIMQPQHVLDPFMGSGTTGVACIQSGRRFVGIEISPQYFKIAVKRIQMAWNNRQGKLF